MQTMPNDQQTAGLVDEAVSRVKEALRGDYTDSGMEDAFFRWPVIERAILTALRDHKAPAEGEVDGLIERLQSHMGMQDVPILLADCRQAAATLASLQHDLQRQRDIVKEAVGLLHRWQVWACGQQGVSPFQDARAFLASLESPDAS
jgi:hypothetical protein